MVKMVKIKARLTFDAYTTLIQTKKTFQLTGSEIKETSELKLIDVGMM